MYSIFSNVFNRYLNADISLLLLGILLSPNLEIGTTLVILRLSGKMSSTMRSFITFDKGGASMYFDNFQMHTSISLIHMTFLSLVCS